MALLSTSCTPGYSPDTYASNAAQQAAKVDQGVVVGVRPVAISADTTLGTTTGAAAGGILGSQVGQGVGGALGAVGGTVAGGAAGNVVSHAAGDTDAYEYIVRKASGDLVSVTQKDTTPLEIGSHVLVIQGPQARIVLDYTVPLPSQAADAGKAKPLTPSALPPAQTPAEHTPAQPSGAASGPPDAHSQPAGAAAPAGAPNPGTIVATPLPSPTMPPAAGPASPPPQPAGDQKPPPPDRPAKPAQAPAPSGT
jgi:outer membrane lipoprotein SlyB